MQFFKIDGKTFNISQMRKYVAEKMRKAEIFCPYCISKAVRHSKECPTKQEGFDPTTAHELTKEEREQLIAQKNEHSKDAGKGPKVD